MQGIVSMRYRRAAEQQDAADEVRASRWRPSQLILVLDAYSGDTGPRNGVKPMSDQQLYSIREAEVGAFLERVRRAVEGKDLETWTKLFQTFDATSTRPFIGYTGTFYPPDRLTRIEYQSRLPDLTADDVPAWDSPSLRWLLRRFVFLSADLQFGGQWPKFAQWFSINLSDELHAKGGPELEEHQLLMRHFFEPSGEFPEPFRVLQLSDSAFESVVLRQQLALCTEVEHRTRLLQRLWLEYRRATDGVTRDLGAEIGGLWHFLQLVETQGRGVYYCQFAT